MSHKDVLKLLFPIELNGVFDQDITLEGQHLDIAQTRGEVLLSEMFPDTTDELIASWERVYNITSDPGDTLQVRRNRILSEVREVSGLHRAYFISLTAALGYTISIEDSYMPFIAGYSVCGDYVSVPGIVYCWTVIVTGAASAPELEAKFEDLKPAHTFVAFEYQP